MRLKKTRLRDFRKKLILSSRMKREWGRGGRKIMQFNPGETEEIEKKKWEKEREGNRVMKLVGKKKKKKPWRNENWMARKKTAEGWKWGMKRRSNGRVWQGYFHGDRAVDPAERFSSKIHSSRFEIMEVAFNLDGLNKGEKSASKVARKWSVIIFRNSSQHFGITHKK